MGHAINHCGMRDAIKEAQMEEADIMEEAIMHADKIIKAKLLGGNAEPHKMPGIQLLAIVIADSSLAAGAENLSADFGIDLDDLRNHAASEHVSYC
ncbi:MAG: hypothetical protein HGB18_01560 [Candidatus Moranbacteria bacterium]|nr:hypothetical protein [Candidatus Moranbacteria bacterium]